MLPSFLSLSVIWPSLFLILNASYMFYMRTFLFLVSVVSLLGPEDMVVVSSHTSGRAESSGKTQVLRTLDHSKDQYLNANQGPGSLPSSVCQRFFQPNASESVDEDYQPSNHSFSFVSDVSRPVTKRLRLLPNTANFMIAYYP